MLDFSRKFDSLIGRYSNNCRRSVKDRVAAAHAARRRAHALLELAKRSVEIAIEETEADALRFLAEPLDV